MALRDISRFDGTARRIAAVSSLTGFTVAVFWLIQIVRGQVPDARTPLVEVVIVYVSILAGLFGLVATRAQVPRWSTLVLHSLSWVLPFGARGFVLKASTTKLTRAQMIVGTPEYMAPEQAAGKVDEIDHRSDQWSLACIAWHMLVGQQPFVGPDVNAILHQVMNGEPPPLGPALAPLLPGQVESVLRKALSKRQIDRFPTITAFAKAFSAAAPLDTPMRPVTTPPPERKRSSLFPHAAPARPVPAPSAATTASSSRPRSRWVWVGAALLATALGIGIALLQSGQLPWSAPRPSAAASTEPAGASSEPASPPPRARKPDAKKRRPPSAER